MTAKTITVQILDRFTFEPIYTTEIPGDTPSDMQTRVALEKAVSDRSDLSGAYLSGAYLRDAYLRDAYLSGANLSGAYLSGANLSGAYLSDAYLSDAYLSDANLSGAYLSGAYLRDAYLRGADLRRADLSGAISLFNTVGDRHYVKSLQVEIWSVTYTATHMQIGCQRHEIDRWWKFSDAQINKMDGRALEWWRKWKPMLQRIIALSPAESDAKETAEVSQADS